MTTAIDSFTGEYRFLSNFHPSTITFEDIHYPTVEHFFQAMKVRDNGIRQQIALTATPGDAKRLGRRVALRADWEQVKIAAMQHGLLLKFAVGSDLASRLLATGERELIEGNTWGDRVWGVCGGTGQNLLGKLLMQRRILLARS